MSDLISRQDALKAVSWDTEAYTAINMLPFAEQKKGEWIQYEYSDFCKCSVCKMVSSAYWNYCPNCGADMRGDNDE